MSEILNETGGYMGMKEINSFSYLDRCIKDGLRLYPSVPTIAREIKEDLQLSKIYIISLTVWDIWGISHLCPG